MMSKDFQEVKTKEGSSIVLRNGKINPKQTFKEFFKLILI